MFFSFISRYCRIMGVSSVAICSLTFYCSSWGSSLRRQGTGQAPGGGAIDFHLAEPANEAGVSRQADQPPTLGPGGQQVPIGSVHQNPQSFAYISPVLFFRNGILSGAEPVKPLVFLRRVAGSGRLAAGVRAGGNK